MNWRYLIVIAMSFVLGQSTSVGQIQDVQVVSLDFLRCVVFGNTVASTSSTEQSIDIDKRQIQSLFDMNSREISLENFPVAPYQKATVQLTLQHVWTSDDITLECATRSGFRVKRTLPTQQFYVGSIVGEFGSSVQVSICNDEMICSITTRENGSFEIAPQPNGSGTVTTHVLKPKATDEQVKFTCGTEVNGDSATIAKEHVSTSKTTLSDELRDVEIAVEIDAELCKYYGGSYNGIVAYVLAVLSASSQIYIREINVQLRPVYVHYWETEYIDDPDLNKTYPYNWIDDNRTLFSDFKNHWNSNFTNVKRDDAILFFAPFKQKSNGSTVILGLSALNAACQPTKAYSMVGIDLGASYWLPRYSLTKYYQDVWVCAHEIGHSLGAPHTHSCNGHGWFSPPLDTCVTKDDPRAPIGDACYGLPVEPIDRAGTLMSYCQIIHKSVDMTFGPVIAQKMRSNIETTLASCITANAGGSIVLTSLLGNFSYQLNTPVDVTWHSNAVATVNVEYSVDSMKTWHPIAMNITAALRKATWTPPEFTTKGFVRVMSTSQALVGDTSETQFTIRPKSLRMFSPGSGLRIGFGQKLNVGWRPYFLTRGCRIQYRVDNNEWVTIADSISPPYDELYCFFFWTIPDTLSSSENVRVRIVGLENDSIVVESPVFAIGKMVFDFTAPKSAERICGGTDYRIQFSADYLQPFSMRYSIDGGATFPIDLKTYKELFAQGVQIQDGGANWSVPSIRSKNMVVGAFGDFNDQKPLAMSKVFEIDSCSLEFFESEIGSLGIANLSLLENETLLTFDMTIEHLYPNGGLHAEVISINGEALISVALEGRDGTQKAVVPIGKPASGIYLLRVRSGNAECTKTFAVVR